MSDDARSLVGQSLMLRFRGVGLTPELAQMLAELRPCGVALFADNIQSPAQLRALTGDLQAQAAALGVPPLLIGVDQEGGIVSRLPASFTTVPSQMAQAATGDPDAAAVCARISGRQLRACGVNLNFAPVLDVNNNPRNPVIGVRSFGQDPAEVARFGLAALRGYRDAGVIATIKHFPGHGDTAIDSHLDLPRVAYGRERLEAVELARFAAAIPAGAPALMTAHIVFEALDEAPATLSRAILTELLRGEFGFDGPIFTDALEMQAIADRYGFGEASALAKAAGADVVLPLGPFERQAAVARALLEALDRGRLSIDSFQTTARRLDRLRAAYQSGAMPALAETRAELDARALDIARRSLTLLGGRAVLPLAANTRLALTDCLLPRFSLAEEAVERAELLRSLVLEAFPQASCLAIGPEPSDGELEQALALAGRCETTLLVTRNAALVAWQARLAGLLAGMPAPLILAAVRGPYDGAAAPGAAATLLTYGDPPLSLHALVEVLSGATKPVGKAPVDLPVAWGGGQR
jgi:beta-N-acetylhexosaminidase